jgi:hypothetical protein
MESVSQVQQLRSFQSEVILDLPDQSGTDFLRSVVRKYACSTIQVYFVVAATAG